MMKKKEREKEKGTFRGQQHKSSYAGLYQHHFLFLFFFVDGWEFSFRNNTSAHGGYCFFVLFVNYFFSYSGRIGLVFVGLEALGWIDGIDWIGLNQEHGKRKRNVRTYCIVLLCSLLAGCAWFLLAVVVGVLCGDVGVVLQGILERKWRVKEDADAERFVTRLFCWIWTTQL
jgi:hypothetical protein